MLFRNMAWHLLYSYGTGSGVSVRRTLNMVNIDWKAFRSLGFPWRVKPPHKGSHSFNNREQKLPPTDTSEKIEGGDGVESAMPFSHLVDRYRQIVFPNNIRQIRRERGLTKLLSLSERISSIPYIRLSKIERGEVFAKAAELEAIANSLGVEATALLLDVDDPGFDFAVWAGGMQDIVAGDTAEEAFAVLLAAAIRHKRETNPRLTIAILTKEYGIPPVILSRLENAFKTPDRWNRQTISAVCRLLEVSDMAALRRYVLRLQHSGVLDPFLDLVANPAHRLAKTRVRIAALRESLGGEPRRAAPPSYSSLCEIRQSPAPTEGAIPLAAPSIAPSVVNGLVSVPVVPVFGAPMSDGLIRRAPQEGITVEAPRSAGRRAYGLRICRPSLGPGLPGNAIVVVDPDRFPSNGGLAVLEEEADALRLLMVTFGRDGRMMGYSEHPNREIAIDDIDPAKLAAVVAARFD